MQPHVIPITRRSSLPLSGCPTCHAQQTEIADLTRKLDALKSAHRELQQAFFAVSREKAEGR